VFALAFVVFAAGLARLLVPGAVGAPEPTALLAAVFAAVCGVLGMVWGVRAAAPGIGQAGRACVAAADLIAAVLIGTRAFRAPSEAAFLTGAYLLCRSVLFSAEGVAGLRTRGAALKSPQP
jgi:hypothetical protein